MKACENFLKVVKNWEACDFDLKGQFGGLLAIWNPKKCKLTPFKMRDGILLVGRIQGFKEVIRLVNIYASYRDIRAF